VIIIFDILEDEAPLALSPHLPFSIRLPLPLPHMPLSLSPPFLIPFRPPLPCPLRLPLSTMFATSGHADKIILYTPTASAGHHLIAHCCGPYQETRVHIVHHHHFVAHCCSSYVMGTRGHACNRGGKHKCRYMFCLEVWMYSCFFGSAISGAHTYQQSLS
jgi:hypothetical protein